MTTSQQTYARRLSDAEVREMRELHAVKGMSAAKIARQFGVKPITVGRVVSHRTYTNVADIEGGTSTCPCLAHTVARRQNVNLGRARALDVNALCTHCGRPVRSTVAYLQAHNGAVSCTECGGER